jgi:hypothetical protein
MTLGKYKGCHTVPTANNKQYRNIFSSLINYDQIQLAIGNHFVQVNHQTSTLIVQQLFKLELKGVSMKLLHFAQQVVIKSPKFSTEN